jgi:hypothetical protein
MTGQAVAATNKDFASSTEHLQAGDRNEFAA